MSGLSIAVADDHHLILEGLRSLLSHDGIGKVTLFRSAVAHPDSLRTHTYHIYVVDLKMPGMDGFDLIRAIRENGRRPVS